MEFCFDVEECFVPNTSKKINGYYDLYIKCGENNFETMNKLIDIISPQLNELKITSISAGIFGSSKIVIRQIAANRLTPKFLEELKEMIKKELEEMSLSTLGQVYSKDEFERIKQICKECSDGHNTLDESERAYLTGTPVRFGDGYRTY